MRAFIFFLCLSHLPVILSYAQADESPLTIDAELKSDLGLNLRGGIASGFAYMGNIDLYLEFDTRAAGLWKGGIFHLNILNTHGSMLSLYSGEYQIASNIEALPGTRLYQAWFRQEIRGFTFIIGQHDLNAEFAYPENGSIFINSSFGIQPDISGNAPISIFPIATLGAILKYKFHDLITLKVAAYDGDPGNELNNPHSLNWEINTMEGALTMGELDLTLPSFQAGSGTLKLGAWHHTANFPSYHPEKSFYKNTQGVYLISDFTLYRGIKKRYRTLRVFSQTGFAPKNCNQIDSYYGAGLVFNGILRKRKKDSFGIAGGYVHFCHEISQREHLSAESVLECTYQMMVNDHIIIQPDLQYIIYPGGDSQISNALVGILRIKIRT